LNRLEMAPTDAKPAHALRQSGGGAFGSALRKGRS
jgi:hypothetical protein